MSVEDLLPYFERELTYFRHLADEFSLQQPMVAGRLRMDSSGRGDPHVERLIQAFALLNARIRHKLDDDFPELTDSMLEILYPHFLRNIPARGIVQFAFDRSSGGLAHPIELPEGLLIEAPRQDTDKICRFQTCAPIFVLPIELASASLEGRPYRAPSGNQTHLAPSVLALRFRLLADGLSFAELEFDRLRLHLHPAQAQNVYELYEMLLEQALQVAVAARPDDGHAVFLPKESLEAVGFEGRESALPRSNRTFSGYRLLTEFFTFPEKFLFVDLVGISQSVRARLEDEMWIYIYFDRTSEELVNRVSSDVIRLNCAPCINRFSASSEIEIDQKSTEYRVIADNRDPTVEVLSVDEVRLISPEGQSAVPVRPLYSIDHEGSNALFWHPRIDRSPNRQECYIRLVDPLGTPARWLDHILELELSCLNQGVRNSTLQLERGRPSFSLRDGQVGVTREVRLLGSLREGVVAPRGHGKLWRVISHLSLNHLSLQDPDSSATALREILKLHDFIGDEQSQRFVESVRSVSTRLAVARVGQGFAQGLEVTLNFDEERLLKGAAYLLANVLDKFLGAYVTMNSFTQLVGSLNQPGEHGDTWRWPPRSGHRTLI
jgi:type VI secretion system protein ImpG